MMLKLRANQSLESLRNQGTFSFLLPLDKTYRKQGSWAKRLIESAMVAILLIFSVMKDAGTAVGCIVFLFFFLQAAKRPNLRGCGAESRD